MVSTRRPPNGCSPYDGRNQEPETLPVKFPLLLAQGAEGIAVGLSCKILPHNFIELIDGCIAFLRKEKARPSTPDFPHRRHRRRVRLNNQGKRGGRVKVRRPASRRGRRASSRSPSCPSARTRPLFFIDPPPKKIPSPRPPTDKGKIKIQRVEDNTADKVEILVYLPSGVEAETAEKGALTPSPTAKSRSPPNICVIENREAPTSSPPRTSVYLATERPSRCSRWSSKIQLGELEEKWHFSSLEKIFIEKAHLTAASRRRNLGGRHRHRRQGPRSLTKSCSSARSPATTILRLLEIPHQASSSKYDSFKADGNQGARGRHRGDQEESQAPDQIRDQVVHRAEEKSTSPGRERKNRADLLREGRRPRGSWIANETVLRRPQGRLRRESPAMKKDEAVWPSAQPRRRHSINQEGQTDVVSKVRRVRPSSA